LADYHGIGCSVCNQVLKPGQGITKCTNCGLFLHSSCWKKNNGCPSLHCHGRPLIVENGSDAPDRAANNSEARKRQSARQAKVFKASVMKLLLFSPLPLLMAADLIYFGVKSYFRYGFLKIEGVMSYNLLFVALPIGFAVILILILLSALLSNLGKKVIITPNFVEYRQWNRSFKGSWKYVSFTPPRPDQKRFRTAVISDGKSFGEINEFFFPNFDLLMEVISYAKESVKDTMEV